MFSSASQAWATRFETFYSIQEQLGREYNLDPCCLPETAKCEKFITPEQDVFTVEDPYQVTWDKVQFFANTEYGRAQASFVKHFVKWCEKDDVVGDLLIPARTDTRLFHDIILPNATSIYFVDGRITFGSDEYWEFVWEQETMEHINGSSKPNTLYKKYGKMNAAPFPSMIVSLGEDKEQTISTIKLAKCKYTKEK